MTESSHALIRESDNVTVLPRRQQQAYDVLVYEFDGRCEASTLVKAIWMRHGIGVAQAHDLLRVLSKKGYIDLQRRSLRTVDWQGVPHTKQISEWVCL